MLCGGLPGLEPGTSSLIRYRGLSAVRTGVFPGHVRVSGAKGCVPTARPDQHTDAMPWPQARYATTRRRQGDGAAEWARAVPRVGVLAWLSTCVASSRGYALCWAVFLLVVS